ncbi:MAG: hypothetical protein ACI837_000288 [Crocinitomicaceae bacterium]|jgi:hypothetical protein
MVDGSRHYCSALYCGHFRDRRKLGYWPLYLFHFLMSKSAQKEWIQLLIIAASIAGLYLVFWKIHFVIIGGSLLVIGINPPLRQLFLKGFNALMSFIGLIKTYLFMGITYFFILCPIALIRGIFKKKSVHSNSTFIVRDHAFTAEDLEKMW